MDNVNVSTTGQVTFIHKTCSFHAAEFLGN